MPGEAGSVPAGRGAQQRGVRVPRHGWHQPGQASRSKPGTNQLGSVPSNLPSPSLSLQAPGGAGLTGGLGGSGTPHAWGRLSPSFSLPKRVQGCC